MSDDNCINNTDVQSTLSSYIVLFNWIYMFLYINWKVISIYFLQADGAGRTIVFLTIVAVMLNFKHILKILFGGRHTACLLWFVLCFYSLVNSLLQGIPSDADYTLFYRMQIIEPFSFLMITTCTLYKQRFRTIWVIFISLFFFVLIGFVFSSSSFIYYGRYINENLGNENPFNAVCLSFTAMILFRERNLLWLLVPVLLLSFFVIILAATRNAFMAIVILIFGLLFSDKRKRKNNILFLFILSLCVCIVALFVFFVLDNTLLGARFNEVNDMENTYPIVSNVWLNTLINKALGDRACMYYKGMALFLDNPFFGIGLNKYRDYTGDFNQIHSEYIIHLCENGIIGFILLISFYAIIGIRLLKSNTKRKSHGIVVSCFIMALAVNVTFWTYCMTMYMIIYAFFFVDIYPIIRKVSVVSVVNPKNSNNENTDLQGMQTLHQM